MNPRFDSREWCVVGQRRKTLIATLLICSSADAAFVERDPVTVSPVHCKTDLN
jgi:hypothetical protein